MVTVAEPVAVVKLEVVVAEPQVPRTGGGAASAASALVVGSKTIV